MEFCLRIYSDLRCIQIQILYMIYFFIICVREVFKLSKRELSVFFRYFSECRIIRRYLDTRMTLAVS